MDAVSDFESDEEVYTGTTDSIQPYIFDPDVIVDEEDTDGDGSDSGEGQNEADEQSVMQCDGDASQQGNRGHDDQNDGGMRMPLDASRLGNKKWSVWKTRIFTTIYLITYTCRTSIK
jgi:hypothetical protein